MIEEQDDMGESTDHGSTKQLLLDRIDEVTDAYIDQIREQDMDRGPMFMLGYCLVGIFLSAVGILCWVL